MPAFAMPQQKHTTELVIIFLTGRLLQARLWGLCVWVGAVVVVVVVVVCV